MGRALSYAALSLWYGTAGDDRAPRPALERDLTVDVAIVGGGFTGLWTAYYLARADPTLRIAVLEREICGFGASGRNGGWASALFPASAASLARHGGRSGAIAMQTAMNDSVVEVGRAAAEAGVECHYVRGGTVVLARTPAQLTRATAQVEAARSWADDDLQLLSAADASRRLNATDVLGGTFTPHCARIHPARLVRGLATTVSELGVRVYEGTAIDRIGPHRAVLVSGHSVRADVVVRATEGFTSGLAGQRRDLAPIYSLMIATEPLPDPVWDEIGLRERETFSDFRHLIIYGQRTDDGRLALGGRGAPYHFGSQVRSSYDRDPAVFAELQRTMVELFPVLHDSAVTHRWGGPLGIPRDCFASVGLDRATGLAWAGGYVGDGVSTTNLAGRTLRDLVLDRASDLTALPWVGHRSRRWEPEPLRWLGVNASLRAMSAADGEERRTRQPSRIAGAMSCLTGGH